MGPGGEKLKVGSFCKEPLFVPSLVTGRGLDRHRAIGALVELPKAGLLRPADGEEGEEEVEAGSDSHLLTGGYEGN